MSRILAHTAVPESKREIAATMAHLSGNVTEHSVECTAIPGGPSALWDTEQGYGGTWYAASQGLAPQIAQDMLASGFLLGTEAWFVAVYEDNGQLIQHNFPPEIGPPADSSFDAFLAACGLERVVFDV